MEPRRRTRLGFSSTSTVGVLAVALGLVAVLVLAPVASADTKRFPAVHKTRKALFFKVPGVDPDYVRGASVTIRYRGGRVRHQKLRVDRARRAAKQGKLRVRRGHPRGWRRGHPHRRAKVKGGKLKVVIEEPTGPVYTVPASVPSGCSSDATSAILSWIASVPDGATLRFGAGACYRVEGTLELEGRNLAIDGNGSTFKALNPPSSHSAIWRAWDSAVSFRNMKIVGSYANGGVHEFDLQWAHAIDLRGTHGVVENVTMSDVAGDCVYFGLGADRSSGAVRNSSCRRTGRNAVSVVAGDDIRVEGVTTDRIGYIAFDVEPDPEPGNGSSRVVFDSNTIGSYYLYAWAVVGNGPVADQAFTNNRVVGRGLHIAVLYPTHRPQRLTVAGNVSDTAQHPAAMEIDGVDGLKVTGNTVPLTSGTMASIKRSCGVNVSGNSYPGGSTQASITQPAC